MSPHTPGPWTWFDYPDGRKLLAAPSRAVIHSPDAPMSCDPEDANLIAAAPELLDALKMVQWAWRSDGQYCACCGRYKVDGHNAVCRVALAIAKAEGESARAVDAVDPSASNSGKLSTRDKKEK